MKMQNKAKYLRFQSDIKGCLKNKPKIEAKLRSSKASAKEDKAKLRNEPKSVAQPAAHLSPSVVVNHSSPKGCPYSGYWLLTPNYFKITKQTQFSLFSFEKQGLTKKQSHFKTTICAIGEICGSASGTSNRTMSGGFSCLIAGLLVKSSRQNGYIGSLRKTILDKKGLLWTKNI